MSLLGSERRSGESLEGEVLVEARERERKPREDGEDEDESSMPEVGGDAQDMVES